MGVFGRYQGKTFDVENMAEKPHDHHFTTSAWEETFALLSSRGLDFGGTIQEVRVWSDGGLKTKENLHYFQRKAKEMGVTFLVNFYCPYHGHNEKDGTFGRGKMKMRRDAPGGVISEKGQIFKAFMDLGCTVQMPKVKVNPFKIKPIKGQIRRFFSWKLEKDGRTWSREVTGEGDWEENPIEEVGEEGILEGRVDMEVDEEGVEVELDQGFEDEDGRGEEEEEEEEEEEQTKETEKERKAREKQEEKKRKAREKQEEKRRTTKKRRTSW